MYIFILYISLECFPIILHAKVHSTDNSFYVRAISIFKYNKIFYYFLNNVFLFLTIFLVIFVFSKFKFQLKMFKKQLINCYFIH